MLSRIYLVLYHGGPGSHIKTRYDNMIFRDLDRRSMGWSREARGGGRVDGSAAARHTKVCPLAPCLCLLISDRTLPSFSPDAGARAGRTQLSLSLVIGTSECVLCDPCFPLPSTNNILLPSACRTILSNPAQAAEGLGCERRRTSGRCAEGSGQAGEEGDWRAGGFRQGGYVWWAAGKKFT